MDFGDKLKQYRIKEGLSQEQLAEKIGVSRQAITKWETKRGLPDVENDYSDFVISIGCDTVFLLRKHYCVVTGKSQSIEEIPQWSTQRN